MKARNWETDPDRPADEPIDSVSERPGALRTDADTRPIGCQGNDKPRLPAKRRPASLPMLRRAEILLSGQARLLSRRVAQVPASAIVSVAAPGFNARFARIVDSPEAATTPVTANDNGFQSRAYTVLRETLLLFVFGATLAGTYYLGRTHAATNVIVVPDASVRGNKVT